MAFRTDDIFAAADHMRRSALRHWQFRATTLTTSRSVRVEPDFVDRLREESILYDRDEDGEYFQIYGPTYGEASSSKIVERAPAIAATAQPTPLPHRRSEALASTRRNAAL